MHGKIQDGVRQQQTGSQQSLFGHPGFIPRNVQASLQLSQPSSHHCPGHTKRLPEQTLPSTVTPALPGQPLGLQDLLLQRICPGKARASCDFLPSKKPSQRQNLNSSVDVTILLMLSTGNKSPEEQLFWYGKSIQLNKFA